MGKDTFCKVVCNIDLDNTKQIDVIVWRK